MYNDIIGLSMPKHFALNANSQLVPETHNFGGQSTKTFGLFLYAMESVACFGEFLSKSFHSTPDGQIA